MQTAVTDIKRRKNSRQRSARRERVKASSLAAIALVILAAVIFGVFISSRSVSAVDQHMYKYYTVVEAGQGDSLWTIAEDNITPGYDNCNELIDEIASINHLNSTYIDVGQKIVVPYYSSDYRE